MLYSFKKLAGKLGANVIILDAMSEPADGFSLLGLLVTEGLLGLDYSYDDSPRKGRALAIYVFPEGDKFL